MSKKLVDLKKSAVGDYLEACGLVDQVLEGVDKIPVSERIKEAALTALCTWKMGLIEKSTHMAGQCCYTDKKIRLHTELLKDGREKDRNDTLLHEVGHLLVSLLWTDRPIFQRKPAAHGKEWKYVTSSIGGIPERCHSYSYFTELSKAKAKHKYTCMDCGYEHFSQRALKNMDRRYHSGCRRKENRGLFTHITL